MLSYIHSIFKAMAKSVECKLTKVEAKAAICNCDFIVDVHVAYVIVIMMLSQHSRKHDRLLNRVCSYACLFVVEDWRFL